MDVLTEFEHTPNSNSWAMNKYFSEIQGYITADNAREVVLFARQKFIETSIERNGPPIIPTVFRNHPQRYEYIRDREKRLQSVRTPKLPPDQPEYKSMFFDDVYMNILCNIRLNEFRGFIKHGETTKLVCLNSKSCAEDAFEELLSSQPKFYSFDFEKVKTSKFADKDRANWTPLPSDCKNSYMFNVEFSAIYPENIVSTVIVTCMECGRFFETVFCDVTKELIKKEVMYNISKLPIDEDEKIPDEEKEKGRTDVIRLQTRGSKAKGCPFMEGLIGFKPLLSQGSLVPCIFTRTRITLYCTRSSPVGLLVHEQYIEPGLFPTFKELMALFNLS